MLLRCATCGFVNQQVDDETAFCPNCGAAYAQDNAPTVAMGSSFVDAPPYHTPIANIPYGTAGATPYRTPATEASYGTPPPPLAGFGPATPPAPAPKPASRAGAFVVGVMVTLAVIVLAGVGYVAYAAIQHTSTTAASTSTTTFANTPQVPTTVPTQTLFTLTPPQGWSMQTAPLANINGIRTSYISPDQTAAISVIVVPGTTPGSVFSLAAIVKALKGTHFIRTAIGTATYPTGIWGKVTGTYLSKDGVPYQIVAMNHHHNKHLFVVVFFAPQSTFTAMDTADFEPLMQSFAFV